MLEIDNVVCARGDRPLFASLSFAVKPGELLHIQGRNGSGKTTLLRTVCGLTLPAHGTIRWQGRDIRALGDEFRGRLAYVGHANGIQGELTAAENLRVVACLEGAAGRVDAALDRLGLRAQRHLPAKVLSQGQRRRLALARLLVADRPLWVLDEPYTALDTDSVGQLQGLLDEHVATGGLVLTTSHQPLVRPAVRSLTLGR